MAEIFSKEDVSRICELYQSGWTLRQIAGHVYCSPSTVLVHLRKNGVKIRPRGGCMPTRLRQKEIDRIRFLYWRVGLSSNEIGAIIGRGGNTVRDTMRRAYIPTRSPSEASRLACKARKLAA